VDNVDSNLALDCDFEDSVTSILLTRSSLREVLGYLLASSEIVGGFVLVCDERSVLWATLDPAISNDVLELSSQTEELITGTEQDLKLSPEPDSPVSRQYVSFVFNNCEHTWLVIRTVTWTKTSEFFNTFEVVLITLDLLGAGSAVPILFLFNLNRLGLGVLSLSDFVSLAW
jgi:hypothetical protein